MGHGLGGRAIQGHAPQAAAAVGRFVVEDQVEDGLRRWRWCRLATAAAAAGEQAAGQGTGHEVLAHQERPRRR
jgi:hypothetical protein